MAALLQAFSSTPPVVRRRAKELLDVVRDAVRKGLSGPVVAPSEPTPVVVMPEDVGVSSEPVIPVASSLCKPLPTSSLFGAATVLLPRPPAVYSTLQSSLFGVLPEPKTQSGRFQDVVNKIHSTLVVAPTVPQVSQRSLVCSRSFSFLPQVPSSSEATEITTAEVVTPEVPIDGATAEIPFVPASQRQTTIAKPEIINDAIVVVGQRQKKRKRATKKAGTIGGSDAKAKTDDHDDEVVVVPFDFASAPNVLDDDGEKGDDDGGIGGRVGKRKRQKRGFVGALLCACLVTS
jgi:exosome complex exonuclease RRP6